jgi:methionine biosynthesis protein MetW
MVAEGRYYDRYWTAEGFDPDTRIFPGLAKLLEANVDDTTACLDVGCGDGGTSGTWLAGHSASYIGVDISSSAIEAARARGLDARLITDASELPFEEASFDLVTCTEVLEHLFEPQAAVKEMVRVLRPGGRLLVTVPNAAHWRNRLDLALLGRWSGRGDDLSGTEPWRDPHIRFFTTRSLRAMLQAAGLRASDAGGTSEIGLLHSIPGLRRLARKQDPGPISRALDSAFPSVAALRLYVVAEKPS